MTPLASNPTLPEPRKYSIYCVTNKVNGHKYIGQTKTTPEQRWRHHTKPSASDQCHCLVRAIRKYGKESFSLSVLEVIATREEANERERFWILTLQTLAPEGYNL